MSSPPKEKIETKGGHLPAGIKPYVAIYRTNIAFVFMIQLTLYHCIRIRPMSIIVLGNVS